MEQPFLLLKAKGQDLKEGDGAPSFGDQK